MISTPGGVTVAEVRSRLERLADLPIRPQTARSLLTGERAGPGPVDGLLDPGWSLAELRAEGDADGWTRLARLPWWNAEAEAAVKPLWRCSVATALMTRRLAERSGLADPDHLARVALLHRLGDWCLAAVAPGLLASLYAEAEPDRRQEQETRWLGQTLEQLGERAAERWGVHTDLRDAVWLFRDERGTLNACAEAPERIRVIQEAVRLVESTPLALEHRPVRELRWLDPERKRLMAEVQAHTSGGLAAPDANGFEERLAREHAALQVRHRELRRQHEELIEEVEAADGADSSRSSASVQTSASPVAGLRRRTSEKTRRIADLERRVQTIVEAHRRCLRQVESSQESERLSALAQFAAGAGHELNNPLAVIMGRAQLLLGRTNNPDAVRSLNAIIGQCQRAHRILRDLIYVARPPAPRPRLCQPGEVVRAGLRDLEVEAEARGVRLIVEPSEPMGWAMTDPDPLRHLADALVRNAIEATPRGGSVRVRSVLDAGFLTWEVLDSGPGLSDEAVERLLDPFYCGRQAGRGLGLGLSRVARYLEVCGGKLRWRTARNRGTLFSVSVPRVEPPPPGAVDTTAPPASPAA